MPRLRLLALLLLVLAALPSPADAADPAAPLAVGDRAPEVELVDQHGTPFRLADALARRSFVVLAFYVKAFTGG
jgi:cytochrome oxidase Cu insertion factor (SCO1/SenC/PrrC family)